MKRILTLLAALLVAGPAWADMWGTQAPNPTGTPGNVPTFGAGGALGDSGFNLTLSPNVVAIPEPVFSYSASGANAFVIRQLSPLGFAATAYRDSTNNEHAAFGYDPTGTGVTAGSAFFEASDLTGTAPSKPWQIVATGMTPACGNYSAAVFSATQSGAILTITSLSSGILGVGQTVTIPGFTTQTITSLGTGTGFGTGTYNVSVSQTIGSATAGAGSAGTGFSQKRAIYGNGQGVIQFPKACNNNANWATFDANLQRVGINTISISPVTSLDVRPPSDNGGTVTTSAVIGNGDTNYRTPSHGEQLLIDAANGTKQMLRFSQTLVRSLEMWLNVNDFDFVDVDHSNIIPLMIMTDGSGAIKTAGPVIMPQTTPASSSATCTTGAFYADASFLYACTATNTWKRALLSAF